MEAIQEGGSSKAGKSDEDDDEDNDDVEKEEDNGVSDEVAGDVRRMGAARLAPIEVLARVKINNTRETPRSTIKCVLQVPKFTELKFSRENLKNFGYSSSTRSFGYSRAIDPLKPFAEESGFSNTLEGYLKDTISVLELFKVVQSYPHESALKKQCLWTKKYLEMELSNWPITSVPDKHLKKDVENALAFPSYASLERLDHRRKLLNGSAVENTRVTKTSYRFPDICSSDILKLAVDDFNFCQSIHREEMERLDRWVVENRLQELKFARQKLAYCYFFGAATLFSPELSDARISWAKGGVLTTVVDDFFDVGGSEEELENLIHLVQKWDLNGVPEYCSEQVEIIFSALRDTILETGEIIFGYSRAIGLGILRALLDREHFVDSSSSRKRFTRVSFQS